MLDDITNDDPCECTVCFADNVPLSYVAGYPPYANRAELEGDDYCEGYLCESCIIEEGWDKV